MEVTMTRIRSFLISGFLSVTVDAIIFSLLTTVGINSTISKGLSFLAGVFVSFVVNNRYTFRDRLPNRVLFFLGYCVSLGINVLVYSLLFSHLHSLSISRDKFISWCVATTCSAIFNYLFMNFVSFRVESGRNARD